MLELVRAPTIRADGCSVVVASHRPVNRHFTYTLSRLSKALLPFILLPFILLPTLSQFSPVVMFAATSDGLNRASLGKTLNR